MERKARNSGPNRNIEGQPVDLRRKGKYLALRENRRSFDCADHDKAMIRFAQDDKFWEGDGRTGNCEKTAAQDDTLSYFCDRIAYLYVDTA